MQNSFKIPLEAAKSRIIKNNFKLDEKFIVYIGIGLVIFIIIGIFTYLFIAPSGAKIIYTFTSGDKDKVSAIKGSEESEDLNSNATNTLNVPEQTIRKNIATFNLKLLSKKIDGVWVNLVFKGDPKEVKIGVKGSLKEAYVYKPLYNSILEGLNNAQNENYLFFWQKKKKYKDLTEFAANPPADKLTATYFYDPINSSALQLNSVLPKSERLYTMDKTLRGTHTLYIRVNKSPFILNIYKQDYNVYSGPDALSVEIDKDDQRILTREIPDDGVTDTSTLKLQPQKETIKIDDPDEGLYKIMLNDESAHSDVLISKIETNQPLFVFSSPVFVLDDSPSDLWTNATELSMKTFHTDGIQTVNIDNKSDLPIGEVLKTYTSDLTAESSGNNATPSGRINTIHSLHIPKNDLIISGDGFFAFDKNSFFNPSPLNYVDLSTIDDISDVDYITADYKKIKKDDDRKIAQVFFNPKDIAIDGDKLYFSLETPGLAQSKGELVINNLEVTVEKPGWFDNSSINKISSSAKAEENIQTNSKQIGTWDKIKNFFAFIPDLFRAGKTEKPAVFSAKTKSKPKTAPTSKPALNKYPLPPVK